MLNKMNTQKALELVKRALASVGTDQWVVRETLVDCMRFIESELTALNDMRNASKDVQPANQPAKK